MEKKTDALEAACKYLRRRGCEVVDEPWRGEGGGKIHLVVRDEDDGLAFVHVRECDGSGGREEGRIRRADFERYAIAWIASHPDVVDCGMLRCDEVDVLRGAAPGRYLLVLKRDIFLKAEG